MTSREQFEKWVESVYAFAGRRYNKRSNTYEDISVDISWRAWQASRAWKKFAEDTPDDRSKILIKGFDEVFIFRFGKVFCMDGDEFDFRDLEWQYLPE